MRPAQPAKECEPISKEQFLQSITATMAADEDFFKKVYSYSYCDSGFLSKAAGKLLAVGRKDIIEKYNQWFARYQEQRDKELKEVAHWYVKQLDDWYEREVKRKSARTDRKYEFTGLPQDW